MRPLGIRTVLDLSYDEALAKVRAALPAEGFGVITEVDVRETLKRKLGIDSAPYMILGACNPQLAHRVLEANPQIGLLLPCNVVVYKDGDETVVEAIDPFTMIDLVGERPEVRTIADDARQRLVRVLDSLAATNVHS